MLRSANALGVAPGGSSRRPAPAQALRLIARTCAPLQPAPAGGMRPASIGWLLRRWHSPLLAFISRPQAAPQLRPAPRVVSALLATTHPTTCRSRGMALSLARWARFMARSAEIRTQTSELSTDFSCFDSALRSIHAGFSRFALFLGKLGAVRLRAEGPGRWRCR